MDALLIVGLVAIVAVGPLLITAVVVRIVVLVAGTYNRLVGARIELHADIGDLGSVRLAAVEAPTAELAAGLDARLSIPTDAPAVLDAKGVRVRYRLRALVDRPLLPDLAVERGLAVVSPD